MKKLSDTRKIIFEVLIKKNYFLAFAGVSIMIFALLYYLTLATTTDQSISIFIMMNGVNYASATFVLLGVIALLSGIYVSLLIFKIKMKGMAIAGSSIGLSGIIAGIFGAGCPMCGSLVFGAFGAPLALFFMPFKGIELRVLSIILLSISIYFLARSLNKCNYPKTKWQT